MTELEKRAFICIDLPSEVIKEIARIEELISKKHFTGKLTELENTHITLKFLGELSEKKIEETVKALEKINFKNFKIKLAYTGTFSHNKMPKIIWVKCLGQFEELHEVIENSLAGLFEKDTKFSAHITLARIKYVKDSENFKEYIKNIKVKNIEFFAEKFSLKSSELRKTGPIHTTIKDFKLESNSS